MDDFFGIGMGEILFILVVAVLLLGPAKMMEFAKTMGRIVGNFKKAGYELTSQVTRELEEEKKVQSAKPPEPPEPESSVSRIDGSA